ncbi:P-loop containing nucleoside triphosphate hydrolase protein [Xylariaceae sp. FL0016]|nr:P-loop containing nucleoside triphosphate hydrolase protein [Xylariaceae sp. FL0016]
MTSNHSHPGSRCEFRTYHTTPNKEGRLKVKPIIDPFTNEVRAQADDAYALIISRVFTIKDQSAPKSVTLKINSPQLLKAFRDVIVSYPTVPSDFNSPFELTSPFQILMHYWDELEIYCNESEDTDVRMHLNLLFEFMNNEIGPDRQKILAMLDKLQITYNTAWVLFRPGDILLTRVLDEPWLLRCRKTVYEENAKIGPYLEVHCTYTDHDGKSVGEAAHKTVIRQKEHFGAENPALIHALPIFPRKYVNDKALEQRLEKRGERFLRHHTWSVQTYEGLAQYLREPPRFFWDPGMSAFAPIWLPFTENGRIILDKATFMQDFYSKTPPITVADPELLLCPPFFIGFSPAKQEWCRFLVDKTSPVQWKRQTWDNLILEDEEKLVLQALVTSHEYPENPRDQPEQKGKGLVMLLHGAPGSGKTLTAEASAELTQRALVSSSMASLNRERSPWVFEYNLRRLLQYATLWKAIVLLDEADVFLEAREEKSGNADRNALVAVFLKELEYFSGIVFLTTNRLGSFDLAMKSRIHLALTFTQPGISIRHQLWRQLLRSVPAEELGFEVDEVLEQLACRPLNGREISNALNTAKTIAKFEKQPLQLAHIQKVLKVREAFDISLKEQKKRVESFGLDITGTRLPRRGSILTEEPKEYGDD